MKKLSIYVISLMLFLTLQANAMGEKPMQMKTVDATKPILIDSKNPIFTVKLKANPSTGYAWYLKHVDSQFIPLANIEQHYQQVDNKALGASGYDYWTFRLNPTALQVPAITSVTLVYRRGWEMSEKDAKTTTLHIVVNGKADN